eukprot:gene5278-3783_t
MPPKAQLGSSPVYKMEHEDQVRLLSDALLREYMHKRGFKKTLNAFDQERPRDADTISSRAVMADLMALPAADQERLKAEGILTIMEMLCDLRIEKRQQVAALEAQAAIPVPEVPHECLNIIAKHNQKAAEKKDKEAAKVQRAEAKKEKLLRKQQRSGVAQHHRDYLGAIPLETEMTLDDLLESDSEPEATTPVKAPVMKTPPVWLGDKGPSAKQSAPMPSHQPDEVPEGQDLGETEKVGENYNKAVEGGALCSEDSLRKVLRILCGSRSTPPRSFVQQGIIFDDPVGFRLIQWQEGPGAVVASIQAFISGLYFERSSVESQEHQQDTCIRALSHILLAAQPDISQVVLVDGLLSAKYPTHDFGRQLSKFRQWTSFRNAREMEQRLSMLMKEHWRMAKGCGLWCFLLSVVLSRDVEKIETDGGPLPLIDDRGSGTLALGNLCLCGVASAAPVSRGARGTHYHCGLLLGDVEPPSGNALRNQAFPSSGTSMNPVLPSWVVRNQRHYANLFMKKDTRNVFEQKRELGGSATAELTFWDPLTEDDEMTLEVTVGGAAWGGRKRNANSYVNTAILTLPPFRTAEWSQANSLPSFTLDCVSACASCAIVELSNTFLLLFRLSQLFIYNASKLGRTINPLTLQMASHEPIEEGVEQHFQLPFGDDQGSEPTPEQYDPNIKWWALSVDNVFHLTHLANPLEGLSLDEVPIHAKELGDNIIPIKGGPSWWWILVSQFLNAITVVLVIVIVIDAVFEHWAELGVVAFVLFFNAFLGFYQEMGAEKSLSSLKNMTAGVAKVMRQGVPAIIFIDEVVVGDVIILEQGATVPADCRVFESNSLEVDEALLTGEALPVQKHTHVIPDPDNRLALGDRKNTVYRNTQVTQGRGKAVVVCAGLETQMGKLAKRLDDGSGNQKTDLQKKLDYLMYVLFGCCLVLALVVFAANKFHFDSSTLSYATAVAIAILPESLYAVVTVSMTISVKKMAKEKCIVRKLSVLEVLGNITDICSDKTGTLTENKMVVKRTIMGLNQGFLVTGAPYDVYGDFIPVTDVGVEGERISMKNYYPDNKHIYEYLKCASLCGSTVLYISETDRDSLAGSGNPTEIAIQVMTWKSQLWRDKLEQEGWQCITEYAFDSSVKRMSAAWRNEQSGELYLCTKGAPERVLNICKTYITDSGAFATLTDADRQKIQQQIADLAEQGLRTICFSYRADANEAFTVPETKTFGDEYSRDLVEQNLTYLGLVGIYDPPRPESRPSVIACQHAGICVRMLTGDHTSTAGTIASMLNIIAPRDISNSLKLLAGPDFDAVDPEEIDRWEDLPVVIGRCSPESKVKMIESLHRRDRVVAMTGDGFNDSPSIKIADVGCAMGSGVDVTKGVADLVITDDNFSTIVRAMAEGRRISQCIKKFVVHLLSSNVAEVIALICGLPIRIDDVSLFVLSPIEILWLNMITSAPPATGLSMDTATDDILQVPPNTKGLFTWELISDCLAYGVFLGGLTLGGFVVILYGFNDGPEGHNCNEPNGDGCRMVESARCTAFGILYFGLLFHSYTVRHPRLSVLFMHWTDNLWILGSCIIGGLLFVPIVYIDVIAHNIFVHNRITWEWAVLSIAVIAFLALCELYKILKNVLFPIPKVVIGDESDLQQEYRTFNRTVHDDRDTVSIAQENLRMSFASYADAVGTGNTASFRMSFAPRCGRNGEILAHTAFSVPAGVLKIMGPYPFLFVSFIICDIFFNYVLVLF